MSEFIIYAMLWIQFNTFNKLASISFSRICPGTDNGFRHNIVKVAAGSLSYCLKDPQLL